MNNAVKNCPQQLSTEQISGLLRSQRCALALSNGIKSDLLADDSFGILYQDPDTGMPSNMSWRFSAALKPRRTFIGVVRTNGNPWIFTIHGQNRAALCTQLILLMSSTLGVKIEYEIVGGRRETEAYWQDFDD